MSGRVIGFGLLIALVPPPAGDAHACLLASPEPVVVEGEESLIVWDEARHREHFIRRADFRNATRPFGFVVPTPGRPSLREVDDAVFARLAALYSAPVPRGGGGG